MSSSESSSASDTDSEKPSSPRLKRKRNEGAAHSEKDSIATSSSSSDSESDSEDTDSEDADADPEVSALSHAERRRQKKKEQQQGNADTPSAAKRRTAAPPKRQHSVWVGNLSFKTTIESLRTFFDGVGEITRVNMPMKATAPSAKPENRGFAYVDFATPEAKAAAIARSEKPLTGRRLLIKNGDDFTGRPVLGVTEGDASNAAEQRPSHSKTAQKILRAQKQPPAPTLFFGNLGFEATEKSIRELLDAHRTVKKKPKGEVKEDVAPPAKDKWIRKVRLGTFEDSGLCKGFAFVDFTSIEHATSALINPKNHHLDGRKLVVEYASADAVRRGGGGPKPAKEDRTRTRGHASGDVGKEDGGVHEPPSKRKKTEEVQEAYENTQSRKEAEEAPRPHWHSRGANDKGPRVRPKPGAALALAKRESAAILPSTGKKITF